MWMGNIRHILTLVTAAGALLGSGLLTGCGYRAALHASYIPEVTDSTLYPGVKPENQQLAAHCREVTLEEVKRWNIFRRLRNWFFYTFGGPVG